MSANNGKTAINMNKQQLLTHLQKGWADPYVVQYNESIKEYNENFEKEKINAFKDFSRNYSKKKPQLSPIEAELQRDMRNLKRVCIMNFILIFACVIAFALVAIYYL